MSRTFSRGVLMAAAGATAVVGIGAPASAQTPIVAFATGAPGCVERVVTGNDPTNLTNTAVTLTNACGSRKKVRVVFRFGPDSGCKTLEPRAQVRVVAASVFAVYDKSVLC